MEEQSSNIIAEVLAYTVLEAMQGDDIILGISRSSLLTDFQSDSTYFSNFEHYDQIWKIKSPSKVKVLACLVAQGRVKHL